MNRKTLAIIVTLGDNERGTVKAEVYPNGRKWIFQGKVFDTGKAFKSYLKAVGFRYKHLYIKQEELPLC